MNAHSGNVTAARFNLAFSFAPSRSHSLIDPRHARRMITMADAVAQIDELVREADAELAQVKDGAALEQFRIKYLGSNGKVKGLMKLMGGIPKEQKPAFGQKANGAKSHIEGAFESKKQAISSI